MAKVSIRAEKKLACDLKPGDLFVMEMPSPDFFATALDDDAVAVVVMLRTNVSDDGLEDREAVVYKLHMAVTGAGVPPPAKVDPRNPPGMKDF